MYGGHITDDWDRKLCIGYLEEYMQPDLVDGELQLAPSFPAPPNTDYAGYHTYIDEMMPPESPCTKIVDCFKITFTNNILFW